MGPAPSADPHPDDKPEVLEHSNQKVSRALMLVTAILFVAVLSALLYRCG
jgi:hypothetical protein